MRRVFSLLILPLLIAPALAQESGGEPAARKPRISWQERFTAANLAHDGHLTLEEAKGGYRTVARHFGEIDVDGKGYVTENDIRAWRALRKAGQAHPSAPEDKLRPRAAYQVRFPDGARPLARTSFVQGE